MTRPTCNVTSSLLVVVLAVLLSGCAISPLAGKTNPLIVSAASNLTPAFRELGRDFTAETGIPVTFNYGSSGKLAQQIEEGAPVDVFVSANKAYVDELARAGWVLPDTVTLYAQGQLTLWTPADSKVRVRGIEDLASPLIKRIAIANPNHAPYGMAARQALQSAGIWEVVQDKLIFGDNIVQTLQIAETANVDAALMALSLSLTSDGQWLLIPQELYAPLDQAMAVVAGTPHEESARRFLAYVTGANGRAVLERYGFGVPGKEVGS